MHLLIDCDTPVYAASVVHENDSLEQACYEVDTIISNILEATKATSFKVFLTGDNNFRYNIYPEYKGNRLGKPVPRHRKDVQDHVARNWDAVVSDGCEADDLLGVAQMENAREGRGELTCISSIDKDLNCIEGLHYHPGIKRNQVYIKDPHFYTITPEEALKFFYTQLLTGDTTDNVKGVLGIGAKKAQALLQDCKTEKEMFDIVRDAYSCDEEMLMNGRVLWIWKKMNDVWEPPYPLGN